MTDWSGTDDDRDAPAERQATYTTRELWHFVRFTTFPTLYVDEDSTTNDLLWQQVLEQRAVRASIWWGIAVVGGLLGAVLGALLMIVGRLT